MYLIARKNVLIWQWKKPEGVETWEKVGCGDGMRHCLFIFFCCRFGQGQKEMNSQFLAAFGMYQISRKMRETSPFKKKNHAQPLVVFYDMWCL